MNEEDTSRVKLGLANQVLNQMTLNHLLDSARVYSTQVAEQHFGQMSDEDKNNMLEQLKANDEPVVKPKRGRPKKVKD